MVKQSDNRGSQSSLESKLLPASQRSQHSQASIDSCLHDIVRANETKAAKEEEDQSTARDVRYRWFVLILFLLAGSANAMVRRRGGARI